MVRQLSVRVFFAFVLSLVVFLFLSPQRTMAQSSSVKCNVIATNPTTNQPLSAADYLATLTITADGLTPKNYNIGLDGNVITNASGVIRETFAYDPATKLITVKNVSRSGIKDPALNPLNGQPLNPRPKGSRFIPIVGHILGVIESGEFPFGNDIHSVDIYDEKNTIDILGAANATPLCTAIFKPQPGTISLCTISSRSETFTSNDKINITVSDIPGDDAKPHRIIMKRNNPYGNNALSRSICNTKAELEKNGISLDQHEAGQYYIEVRDSCNLIPLAPGADEGPGEQGICHAFMKIEPPGSTGGGIIKKGGGGGDKALAPFSPCAKDGLDKDNNCTKFTTAIGTIDTQPTKFIERIYGIILSLAGGIATLLIIFAGYKLVMARGNPEKVQGARETLTSAIVGLLFIIFSFFILQLIGVQILRLPGFNP